MKTKILNFRKTDHFLYSQWRRNVEDQLLYKLLPYVKCTMCNKDVIIVYPSFLRKLGVSTKNNDCLVIITSDNVLITCYWCDHVEYLFSKELHAHFQILTK